MPTKEQQLPLTVESTGAEKETGFDLSAVINFLDRPEFEGTIGKYPGALILNQKDNPGIFLKQTDIAKSGWLGLPHNGKDYLHTFNDGGSEPGVLFQAPNLVILAQSPRYIELTMKGEEAGLGNSGTIVGIFADEEGNINPDGSSFYEELQEKATLRTFYLLYLVNDDNQELHKIPFCLSVRGVAASSFGRALEAFANDYYSVASAKSETATPLNQAARSLFVFTPRFKASLEPKNAPKKSWCAIVGELEGGGYDFSWKPLSDKATELEKFNKRFTGIRRANNNFSSRYLAQVNEETGGKIHAIAPGVDLGTSDLKTVDATFTLD